jgi:hypothetical protein
MYDLAIVGVTLYCFPPAVAAAAVAAAAKHFEHVIFLSYLILPYEWALPRPIGRTIPWVK